jgi:hypothetical protein
MRFNGLVAAAAALLLSVGASAQLAKGPEFSAQRFRSHVAYLADDRLEGRGTGERGHEMAAAYVAGQFAALGLTPGASGNWYQRVPFVEYQLGGGPAVLSIAGRAFSNGPDVAVEASPLAGQTRIEAPVVFAGFGIEAPAAGFNDYQRPRRAGEDRRGARGAFLAGITSDLPPSRLAWREAQACAEQGRARNPHHPAAVGRIASPRPPQGRPLPEVTWVAPGGAPTRLARLAFTAHLNRRCGGAVRRRPKPLQAVFEEADTGRGGPERLPARTRR